MVRTVVHILALRHLRSVGFAKDIDGDVFVGVGDARRCLGLKLHVSKPLQTMFLNELRRDGLLEFVDKKTLRLLK